MDYSIYWFVSTYVLPDLPVGFEWVKILVSVIILLGLLLGVLRFFGICSFLGGDR